MAQCPKCGRSVTPEEATCLACGAELKDVSSNAAPEGPEITPPAASASETGEAAVASEPAAFVSADESGAQPAAR